MSHILGIWELGDDLGHLHRLSALASELLTRGHKVSLVIKDLSRAEMFFRNSPVTVYQAPIWTPRPTAPRLTKTVADILAYKGYGEVDGLMALVKAWRSLFDLLKPDLCIFDYAPTAMFAASDLKAPKVIFTGAFSSPAPGVPGIDLCPWVPVKAEAVARAEQLIVGNINAVAASQGLLSVRYVGDLFEADQTFLADLPLFDMYGSLRKGAIYTGQPWIADDFRRCDWGEAGGKRLFAYLKPGRPHVETALKVLANSEANVRVYYPGKLPPELIAKQSSRFMVSDEPFGLAEALISADAVVTHGGVGVASMSLLAGLPMLILPTHLEQKNNAMQIHQANLGTWIAQERSRTDAEDVIQQFIENSTYKASAEAFAEKFASIAKLRPLQLVADACDCLLGLTT